MIWPEGFRRIPGDHWVEQPPETLALKYDTVERHGWYRNLDRTVADLRGALRSGDLVLDYSGGTGILAARLLEELPLHDIGILIVDASPKFLRVALEKLRDDERVAFRLLRYLKDERRLELVQEALEPALLARGVDAVASTNAVHLYNDLDDTFRSWSELLRPGGRAFVQSGNIGVAELPPGVWIIDQTVEAIAAAAAQLVREDDAWATYRLPLEDSTRQAVYDELRRKVFLPVRALDFYLAALARAGFRVVEVVHEPIEADVGQWYDFLATYHEGVLGWIGGSARIEGEEPSQQAVADRLRLLRAALDRVFAGAATFDAVWTYVTAEAT